MLELKLKNDELKKLMCIMHDCLSARSREDILRIIDLLNEVIPFNAAHLGRQDSTSKEMFFDLSVNHSYPEDWAQIYIQNKLYQLDPVALASSNTQEPFTWAMAYREIDITNEIWEFIGLAEDYGMKAGVACRCSNTEQASVNSLISLETSGHKVADEYLVIIEYILPHLHAAMGRIDKTAQIEEDHPVLTVREKETLKWAYEGKTAWEIGVILSISERTVKFHLNNIYHKLNVTNRSQAVVTAIRHGIV